MRELIVNSGGLGAVPTFNTNAELVPYCSASWLNYFTASGCWNYSKSAWDQMAALPPVPNLAVAPGAPADALTNPTGAYAPDSTVGQDLSNAAIEQTQQNIADRAQTIPDNPVPAAPCSWFNISCSTWAIVAAVGFFGFVVLGAGSPVRYGR